VTARVRLPALVALTAAVAVAVAQPSDAVHGSSARPAVQRQKRPAMKYDPIPFGHDRKHQMANYSKRHYGERAWRLNRRQVRAVVLHYTAGSSYSSAWNTFASNAPALGERPGVCAQFIVDKDGTVYRLTSLKIRCRHAIGINHRSIGIEMVQQDLGDPVKTAEAILDRHRQVRPAVRLVAWLKQRYHVKRRDIIGHAMVNDSHLFQERTSWRNDHSDWLPKPTHRFRKRVSRQLRR